MKRTYIAAAALLLGTSVIAWAQSEPVPAGKDPLVATTIIVKPTVAERIAAKEAPMGLTKAVAADPETADAGWTDISQDGVGGPVEPAEVATAMTAADLTPRPATHNYPPCDPGPGDDNCIQLYEPGVRVALASWNQPTGGLVDHAATTAMGGPYEPLTDEQIAARDAASGEAYAAAATVDTSAGMGGPYEPVDVSGDMAMNGDLVVDPALGETAALEGVQTAEYTGVGGPIAETGYPPCRPGPGDDRCIQLYERGVTGAGN